MEFNLPKSHKPYIDKYFLRSKEVLYGDDLNPIVKYRVFIRNADGSTQVYGINEAIAIIRKYTNNSKNIKIMSLNEAEYVKSCDTIMTIEGPVQDLIELETMYLGVISASTTLCNDGNISDIDTDVITARMQEIVKAAVDRPVIYMGSRHWRYDRDYEVSKACFEGGASDCSTDIGASSVGKHGVGTIPHALEAIYHWKYGLDSAVVMSTRAFDAHIVNSTPRVALIDYANNEVTNALDCIRWLDKNLYGVRIDTCGENFMQGVPHDYARFDRGVTPEGVYIVRKILDDYGFKNVKIILSSGFSDVAKIKKFVDFEHINDIKLFDCLGVGQVFYSRCATGDIVSVEGKEIHKVGRGDRENELLKEVKV